MTLQLPLPLHWPDQATFDNFYVGDNAVALNAVQQLVSSKAAFSCVYIHGAQGAGLSHVLYAACHAAHQVGSTASYLPLQKTPSPQLLEGLEQLSLVCWDDVDAVAGQRAWEEALFHSYNRMQATGTRLLVAAHAPPGQIAWSLPDLGSRLAASTVFAIKPLSDEDKLAALQQRAKRRGLELADEVGLYLLHHGPRDTHALFASLEKLDQFSLATQRRLTIPFVKQVLQI